MYWVSAPDKREPFHSLSFFSDKWTAFRLDSQVSLQAKHQNTTAARQSTCYLQESEDKFGSTFETTRSLLDSLSETVGLLRHDSVRCHFDHWYLFSNDQPSIQESFDMEKTVVYGHGRDGERS
jgi:hypothetical protein